MSDAESDGQGSAAWFASKLGQVGASQIVNVMAKGKGASRANLMATLLLERLTGVHIETFSSPAMKWGNEMEPKAREYYGFMTNTSPTLAKYVPHPTIPMTGASPDSYVGDDGLMEIKCPLAATHLETLLGAKIDRAYVLQTAWQMACTGRAWVDFVSYSPLFPAHLQFHCRRVMRDSVLILEISREVIAFNAELDAKITELKAKFPFPEQQAAE